MSLKFCQRLETSFENGEAGFSCSIYELLEIALSLGDKDRHAKWQPTGVSGGGQKSGNL